MSKSTIIAVTGKGGVGKTSLSATIVRCLTEKYPDKKILAIDADPAVGLSTALGIDVKMTIDDIRKEIIASVDEGDTRGAVELLGEAKYRYFRCSCRDRRIFVYCCWKTRERGVLL